MASVETTGSDGGRNDAALAVVGSSQPGPAEIGHVTGEHVERPMVGTLARGRYEAQPWMIWSVVAVTTVLLISWWISRRRRPVDVASSSALPASSSARANSRPSSRPIAHGDS